MNIKKRAVACVTAMALLTTSVQPLMANDLQDMILSNATSAGSWTDPVHGDQFFTGGSYEFRFKNSTGYAPWFDSSKPGVKAGCNGLSIDGGFIALLGFEDIKNQLSDATAAFAWGIIIGLVYSMPGIADAFQKIQKWARAIQKLLQNSCQIGQNLVKGTLGEGTKHSVEEYASNLGMRDSYGILNNMDKFFDTIDEFTDCAASSNPTGCKQKLGQFTSNMLDPDGKDSPASKSNGSTATNVLSTTDKTTAPLNRLIATDLEDYWSTGNISDAYGNTKVLKGTADEKAQRALFSKIQFAFYGDIGVSSQAVRELEGMFTNGEPDQVAVAAYMKRSVTEGGKLTMSSVPIHPVITDPKKAAKYLVEGFENGKIVLPNYRISYLDMAYAANPGAGTTSGDSNPTATPSTSKKRVEALFLTAEKDTVSDIANVELNWAGSFDESLKGVRAMVSALNGVTVAYPGDTHVTGPLNTDPATINTTIAPLVIPGIHKFVQIIADLERKKGEETAYTSHLKHLLARENSILVVKSMANNAYARIIRSVGDTYARMPDDSAKVIALFLKETKKRHEEIMTELDKLKSSSDDFEKIVAIFKRIKQERSYQTAGGM